MPSLPQTGSQSAAQSTWSGADSVGLGDGDGAVAVGRRSSALGAARHASTTVVAEACKQGTFAAKSTSSVRRRGVVGNRTPTPPLARCRRP